MNDYLCKGLLLGLTAMVASGAIYAQPLYAQPYPARTVRIVVPFPAGAGGDFVTRLFTPKLGEALGQQFVVDNRSGAAGNIGAEAVARAAPDGYTLLTVSASLAIGQSLAKAPRYDLVRDFEPIALLASTPYMLAVHPSVPVSNVKELIALARARPGQLSFGSSGSGSGTHLAGEMLKMQGKVDMLHVPYKGTAPAISDLIGGQLSMMFATQLSPQIKAGRVRALAITSPRRSQVYPELPTVAESGLPGFEAGTWFGLIAPAGTSREITARLNAGVARISQLAEIRNQLMTQSSAEPLSGSPEQAGAYVMSEIAKWKQVLAASGLHPE